MHRSSVRSRPAPSHTPNERNHMDHQWKIGDLVAWNVNSRYGIVCRVGTIKGISRTKCLVSVKIRYFASELKFVGRAEKASVPKEASSLTIIAAKAKLEKPTDRELKALERLA